jgi:hypothetical protein
VYREYPVGTNETVNDDPLALGVALIVRDGDSRHTQVALVLVDLGSLVRIAEPQLGGIAQVERLEYLGRLLMGRILQVEPQHLTRAQVLERPGPVVDDFALPFVEQVGPHNAMITRTFRGIFVHLGYTTRRPFVLADPSPPSTRRFGPDAWRVVVR